MGLNGLNLDFNHEVSDGENWFWKGENGCFRSEQPVGNLHHLQPALGIEGRFVLIDPEA